MPSDKIMLMASARKAGVEGYRSMSESELRAALKTAQGKGSAPAKGKAVPAKGKATTNGSKGKSTAPAKGKASPSTSAPTKSTSRKTAPAKVAAAKGAQAKRPTTGRGRKVTAGTRATIGRVNWNRESNVGQTGKRKEVLDALREAKGDYSIVFKKLKRKATRYYPDRDQHAAERMLVWLIGRVAYDYAYKTGQHEPAERAAYGTSESTINVKRREARAAAARAAKRSAKKATAKPKSRKGR
jgi:hypothetical protein